MALAFWAGLRNQNTPPEFTVSENGQNYPNQFYVLHGYANPANRSAKIHAPILRGSVFAGTPRHVFPFFGQARNTDLPGIQQFATSATNSTGKRILVGHSCGTVDALNHVLEGTLPDGIDAVIAVSPFGHSDDIADAYVPSWAPGFVKICLRSIVQSVLVKFRHHQPGNRFDPTRMTTPVIPDRLKTLPILILGCQGDRVVPSESTRSLGVKFQNVYTNTTVVVSEKPANWYSFSVHDYAATTAENVLAINTFINNLNNPQS